MDHNWFHVIVHKLLRTALWCLEQCYSQFNVGVYTEHDCVEPVGADLLADVWPDAID